MGGYNKSYSVRNPITVTGGGEPSLTSKTFVVSENGYQTWNAVNYGCDGFSDVQFFIDVPYETDLNQFNLIDKTVTTNGWFYPYNDNCDGYRSVITNISFPTDDIVQDISSNGNKNYRYRNYGSNYMKTFTVNVDIKPDFYVDSNNGYIIRSGNTILSIPNRSSIELTSSGGTYNTIGKYAAYKNDKLERFSFAFWAQNSNRLLITEIKESAFENCTNLNYMQFPNALISIRDNAFKNDINLYNTEFGHTVSLNSTNISTIGNSAFEGCTNITRLELPSTITSIGNNAFKDTKLCYVRYYGNKSDWGNVTLGTDWIAAISGPGLSTFYTICCNDGSFDYNYDGSLIRSY